VTRPAGDAWAVTTRWRSLDPLLPPAWTAELADTVLSAGASTGFARRVRLAPDDPSLLWGAADRHQLRALAVGPDLAAGLDGVLTAWRRWIAGQPDAPAADSAASIHWPSRDTRAVPALHRHGLSPFTVVAARRAGTRPACSPPSPRAVRTVRRAAPGDLDAMAGLDLSLLRYEADLGTAYLRDRAGEWIRDATAQVLAGTRPWAWVAEEGGSVLGLVAVAPPQASGWMEPFTRTRPVAYLSTLFVDPAARGAGLGGALVEAAHRDLDAAGVAVTLLHYAQASPVSGPFWHRQGYRPLWTTWQARPAAALR
jgi:GNAT superfamily N-acetyltransferase